MQWGVVLVYLTDWLVAAQGKVGRSMDITIGILDLLVFQTNYLKPKGEHPD